MRVTNCTNTNNDQSFGLMRIESRGQTWMTSKPRVLISKSFFNQNKLTVSPIETIPGQTNNEDISLENKAIGELTKALRKLGKKVTLPENWEKYKAKIIEVINSATKDFDFDAAEDPNNVLLYDAKRLLTKRKSENISYTKGELVIQ